MHVHQLCYLFCKFYNLPVVTAKIDSTVQNDQLKAITS